MTTTADMLAVALDAVARGWKVFPLRPNSKKPPALHGERDCPRTGICATDHQGWEQRAMGDPDRVRWFWTSRRFCGCNVGIATGPSGLVVVDLDMPKSPADRPKDGLNRGEGIRDGADVFTAVCADLGHQVPWETTTVRTPTGGTHLYYAAPQGVELRNTEGSSGHGLGWKVDTRAWGGYVVAPGSITPAGTYRLIEDRAPLPLPSWLTARLTPPPPPAPRTAAPATGSDRRPAYVAAAIQGECDRVAAARPSQHTRTLFSASGNLGQLVGGGLLPPVEAETALYAAAAHMITGPCACTDHEIRRTITNGLRAGAAHPRTPAKRGAA
ncbi:bifunctional DNA primase/polymerase [Actinokineospora iranica]|uniref:Bifunctional DNA primase/polymerase, N-terminal n=1 Tax=Actinokineospora iranica TaxID=1271860 RepID=A0A1G6YZF2_9PSEU|nr:bifunctional DNA primase/polymerase [Actinokineospora iranica]SDD94946.1 Bifunctional DNA primase/polymerase, N-terminal [Actinokineospora iranica]